MKENIKKNLPLYAGLAIPVVMIIAVALAVYAPGWFAPAPQQNFVYVSTDNAYYPQNYEYVVTQGRVEKNPVPNYNKDVAFGAVADRSVLYEYDVTTKQAHEISLADAQKLSLDPSNISSDGYQVVSGGNNSDGLFFGGGIDYNSQYLKGHGTSKKINVKLTGSNNYSYYNFRFLGWVK